VSTMDITTWVRVEASIVELRDMREACERELAARSYVCGACGNDIPNALPVRHPAHDKACLRYASMVSY
jgi:hypothetical protein